MNLLMWSDCVHVQTGKGAALELNVRELFHPKIVIGPEEIFYSKQI